MGLAYFKMVTDRELFMAIGIKKDHKENFKGLHIGVSEESRIGYS